jgi:hypothetical protein
MPRSSKTTKVEAIPGEVGRFRAESWSHPQRPHLVDLLDRTPIGSCSCLDYTTRRWPAYKLSLIVSNDHRCKHIRAAREHFLNLILEDMAETQLASKYAT